MQFRSKTYLKQDYFSPILWLLINRMEVGENGRGHRFRLHRGTHRVPVDMVQLHKHRVDIRNSDVPRHHPRVRDPGGRGRPRRRTTRWVSATTARGGRQQHHHHHAHPQEPAPHSFSNTFALPSRPRNPQLSTSGRHRGRHAGSPAPGSRWPRSRPPRRACSWAMVTTVSRRRPL